MPPQTNKSMLVLWSENAILNWAFSEKANFSELTGKR